MNIVFVNTLEKQQKEESFQSARVSIGETEGVWQAWWSEAGRGGSETRELWYEGASWDELLTAFRQGLREKFRVGYRPLISGEWEQTHGLSGKAKLTQMLAYYSELYPNEELFEELRRWRREQASREGKAPYMLATNRILHQIAAFVPYTPDELLQIPGFGVQKTAVYGADVLKLTAAHSRETCFPLDWVAKIIDTGKFESWVIAQKEHRARVELDKEENKRCMLGIVAAGGGIDALEAAIQSPRRELLLLAEELEKEGYDMEPLIEAELAEVPEERQAQAWQAFDKEGDRYLKPILQHVYGADSLKDKELDRAYEWLRLLRLRYRKDRESTAARAS